MSNLRPNISQYGDTHDYTDLPIIGTAIDYGYFASSKELSSAKALISISRRQFFRWITLGQNVWDWLHEAVECMEIQCVGHPTGSKPDENLVADIWGVSSLGHAGERQ